MTTMNAKHDDSRMTLLYLVSREFNEHLDLDRTIRRVLIATSRVVGAPHGSFFLFDDHENVIKTLFVDGTSVVEEEREAIDIVLERGLAGWVKSHKTGVLIQDTAEDSRWYNIPPSATSTVHRSAVVIPLLTGQKLVGILTFTHTNPGYFDQSDLTILNAIADQATSAILNARIYHSEQRRHKLSTALAEISSQMNTAADLDELFDSILDQLAMVVEYDQSIIYLLNDGYLTPKVARGIRHLTPEELGNLTIRLYKNDFALQITREYLPIWTADLQAHNSWFKDVTDKTSRSWIGVPLVSNNTLLGIITVARRAARVYNGEDAQMANTLASQAAIVVNNIGLLNQLRAAQSRYTRLFEESSDILLIMDTDGFILDANRKASQVLRRPKDAIIGSHLGLLGLHLRDVFNEQLADLMRSKELTKELVIQDAYRHEIPVEINAKQVEIDGKMAIQWAGRDMTARYEMAKMRQDLINMIVHDLRGPMGTLLGAVEMMPYLLESSQEQPGVADALDMVYIAMRTGKALRDLIDSVLDLSKMEQGNFPLKLNAVKLAALLVEVEDQVTPQAKAKRIMLDFLKADDLPILHCDESMIRRVLVNLVDNAIKYTQSTGTIKVDISLTEQKITFKIIDNGPGISPENQKRIFDKFARVDHTSKIHGVGLGLAFCKLAVEAHQGRIWIESELNVGSTFIFEIPRDLLERNRSK